MSHALLKGAKDVCKYRQIFSISRHLDRRVLFVSREEPISLFLQNRPSHSPSERTFHTSPAREIQRSLPRQHPRQKTGWWNQAKDQFSSILTRFRSRPQERQVKVRRTGNSRESARMKATIQFLSTPTSDTPGTSLLLHFDDKRYVIGQVHEGLQRAGLQLGARFLKVKDVLLTGRTEWHNTGGLMGLILTMADIVASKTAAKTANAVKKHEKANAEEQRSKADYIAAEEDPTIRIHGGPNLTHTLATGRAFIFRQGCPITIDEFPEHITREEDWEPSFQDHRVRVWAMPITPTGEEDSGSRSTARKRTLAEYMGQEDSVKFANAAQEIRRHVVKEMFSSGWRFDKLVETPLHEVTLPAAIFVRDEESKGLKSYEGPLPGDAEEVPNINVLVRQPWPGAIFDRIPQATPSRVALSYIIRTHTQRGKFLVDKAKKLGVVQKWDWTTLANGSSITLDDGREITPEMVLEPSREGNGLAFLDVPSSEYLDELLERPEWTTRSVMTNVDICIWILGPGLLANERLLEFMRERKTNNPKTQHIVSSPDLFGNQITMDSAAAAFVRQRAVDPVRFSSLQYEEIPPPPSPTTKASLETNGHIETPLYEPAIRGLTIQVEPELRIQPDRFAGLPGMSTNFDEAKILEEIPEGLTSDRPATHIIDDSTTDLPSPDAEIICLGTGSAQPSQHRNVAGTLLRVPGCGSYLFDCGENTLGQLQRIYPEQELQEVLRDLKMIWISHLHADHHLGTVSVIKAWKNAVGELPRLDMDAIDAGDQSSLDRRLFVVSRHLMIRWLEEYSGVEDFGFEYIVPLKTQLNEDVSELQWAYDPKRQKGKQAGPLSSDNPTMQAFSKVLGLSDMAFCFVSHCVGAQAVSLTFPTGFKFSYSGDARPSKKFAEIGQGSTVLLHEATFDDDMQGDAKAKKHSTISEAIGVGLAMGAERILLTHFSQRYSKLPSLQKLDPRVLQLQSAEDVNQAASDHIEAPVDENSAPSAESQEVEPMDTRSDAPPEPTTPQLQTPSGKKVHVGVAFDYMRVRVKDISSLGKYYPAMQKMYAALDESEDRKRKEAREINNANARAKAEVKKNQKQAHMNKQKEASNRSNAARRATVEA